MGRFQDVWAVSVTGGGRTRSQIMLSRIQQLVLNGTAIALPSSVETIIRSVLVVDDDEDWRILIADALSGAGFAVSTASDGRAGLACLRRVRPDVVVTDVEMPFMDGRELLARVRSSDPDLPVVVLTASDASNEALFFPGAFRVIRKPATTDAVVCVVREAAAVHHRVPRLRRVASAVRAISARALDRGSGALATTANLFRQTEIAQSPIVSKRRRRGRLAVAAGFGVAAAAAVVIAAIRSLAA
jgi:CheY-like chemotaxis protein